MRRRAVSTNLISNKVALFLPVTLWNGLNTGMAIDGRRSLSLSPEAVPYVSLKLCAILRVNPYKYKQVKCLWTASIDDSVDR
jgi:hypothetical protein